jgi:hypothetical protein
MRDANGKPRIKYFGVVYTDYTPAVESQMLRDCLAIQNVARTTHNEVVIVSGRPEPERMLAALGLTLLGHHEKCRDWISYRTEEEWPQEPENARNLILRDLWMPVKEGTMTVLNDGQNNGYYLPPQGRLSPDTLSLLRPAPNGYSFPDPSLFIIWGT